VSAFIHAAREIARFKPRTSREYFKRRRKIPGGYYMRSIVKLAALTAICAAFACAESWSGRLLDASCVDQQKAATCDPTTATVAFAINVSGKVYKLDDVGNAKAVEAMKARGSKDAGPAAPAPASTAITAKVGGTLEGEIVKVESIQLQ
jgi:hypothetical protein